MKVKTRQIITSAVVLVITFLAIFYKPFSNIHLVLTLLFGVMMAYNLYQLNDGKEIKNPYFILYQITFIVVLITSIAVGWWFTAIIWAYISTTYFALKDKREGGKVAVENKI